MICDDYKNCPLYLALMSQLEAEMKRWQNRIRYIDEPVDKMSRADRVQYYQGKIDEITERLININDFMRKRNA